MRLCCSTIHRCKRVFSSLPGTSLRCDVSYQFSHEFIAKHRGQLFEWNSYLLKAQERRYRRGQKNRITIDSYLSKLRNAFANQRRNIVAIGSSVNGLNGKNSDLDVVLVTHQDESKRIDFQEKFKSNEHFRRNQMNAVASLLKNAKLVVPGSMQQVLFTKVPLLKFTSSNGITVDLQFNNIGPIRSSLFVRTCVQFSSVVPVVMHWMNSFFDAIKLKNSRHGLFSTYHLNMLALHFLQTPSSSLLPDLMSSCPLLRPDAPWQQVAEALTSLENIHMIDGGYLYLDISPAEVIVKMVDYYSQVDLHNICIDVCGKTYKRIADPTDDGFIQLIDPYFPDDTSPHARCAVRNGPSLVQQAFSALKSDLIAGRVPKFFRFRIFRRRNSRSLYHVVEDSKVQNMASSSL